MHSGFHIRNRAQVAASTKNDIVVISSNDTLQKQKDAAYYYTQDSNFWYLTGLLEANWLVIIDSNNGKEWLVQPTTSEVVQVFDGSLSKDSAMRTSGIKSVISADESNDLFRSFAQEGRTVSTLGPDPHRKYYSFVENPAQARLYRRLKKQFSIVEDCRSVLTKFRAIKSDDEIAAIRRSVDLTVDAFTNIKPKVAQLTHEYQVQAEFDYYFAYRNAKHAYDPIVASGINAITLHYNKNDAALKSGEPLLLDVGASVDGYPADISRTWAVGEISQRQQDVWSAVNNAHQQIISMLRPGLPFEEYLDAVDTIMKKALESVKLNTDDYRKYFPHAISHGLGIDVHDSLGGYKEFQPGMVLTVEPGIYIKEEGIGVRIEDDILITNTGHDNLSKRLSTEL